MYQHITSYLKKNKLKKNLNVVIKKKHFFLKMTYKENKKKKKIKPTKAMVRF
jgi:hypothetical protein